MRHYASSSEKSLVVAPVKITIAFTRLFLLRLTTAFFRLSVPPVGRNAVARSFCLWGNKNDSGKIREPLYIWKLYYMAFKYAEDFLGACFCHNAFFKLVRFLFIRFAYALFKLSDALRAY